MCSALHYKSFLMHGIQTLLKPLRWSSLPFPLPPSYFHHSISTMLFQNSLQWEKRKTNFRWKKDFQPAKYIYIFTFGKCIQWIQRGNRFKGTIFCCKIVFEWIGFCCGWLWVCWVAAIEMELCAWQLFCLFFAICTNTIAIHGQSWCALDWNNLISFCFLFSHECINASATNKTYPIQTYLYFSTYSLFQRWYLVTVTWLEQMVNMEI